LNKCAACGLELPAHARFCARCGIAADRAGSRRWSPWIPVLLGIGSLVGLLIAFGYWSLLRTPELMASRGINPAEGRPIAAFFTVWAFLLVAVQLVAIPGLVRGRPWGRLAATAACALWSVTGVGVPLSLLVLYLLWRRAPAGGPAQGGGTLGR